MCWEIYTRAHEQAPSTKDGVRRSRWGIIRNTYPELKATTIKTWLDWFPEEVFGPIKWDVPITHVLRFTGPDGIPIELEVLFVSMDKPKDVKKLLSLDLTGCWINEAREIPKAVIDAASGRVSRYPGSNQGGCTWSGVIMDTNPPDDDHWWYKLAEEETPELWSFYRQPGGLDKDAENLNWLNQTQETLALPIDHPVRIAQGRLYYERIAHGKDQIWKDVYIHAKYGTIMDGKPIYGTSWNDRLHVSEFNLSPIKGLEIVLGWDFGLTPAVVIGQMTRRGQLRILEELVFDGGVQQFAESIVKPLLDTKYDGFEIVSWGDPSGVNRSDPGERTAFDALKEAGIFTKPAKSNSPDARWAAVRQPLGALRDGQPAFLLDPRCKILRKGFNGGYRFKRMQVSGEERYSDKADKNSYSHPHDALQYLCMYFFYKKPQKRRAQVRNNVVDRTMGL
jgi:hypothetical protein